MIMTENSHEEAKGSSYSRYFTTISERGGGELNPPPPLSSPLSKSNLGPHAPLYLKPDVNVGPLRYSNLKLRPKP
jgi:hypothetical protein